MNSGSSTLTLATGPEIPMLAKYAAHSMLGASFWSASTPMGWSTAFGSRRATRSSWALARAVSSDITRSASATAAALSSPAKVSILATCAT